MQTTTDESMSCCACQPCPICGRENIDPPPQMLAEVKRLEAIAKTLSERIISDRDQMCKKIDEHTAEAAEFRWLVELVFEEGIIFHSNDDGAYQIIRDGIGKVIGTGTTPLEAVEDAKRRSEG